jgi:hypothetical protein
MQPALSSQSSATVVTTDLWREIDEAVREACILRAEGREAESMRILQEQLPGLISAWSRGTRRPAEALQQELRELFARVQQQVATATICKRLVLRSVESPRALPQDGSDRVVIRRRQIPLDDIPGMLDALDESERSSGLRRHNLPSPVLRRSPALAGG